MRSVIRWMKDERSVSEASTVGMLLIIGIIVAIGFFWLVSHYTKKAGTNILEKMAE